MTALAIALASISALFNAVAARLQHGGLRVAIGGQSLKLRTLLRLVRQPTWLLGMLSAGAGVILHVSALGLAPLSVVQPIGVVAFALSTVISVKIERLRLNRIAVLAVVASTIGTVAFVLLVATTAQATHVPPTVELQASEFVVITVLVLVVLAILSRSRVRSLLCAAAAGVAFGFVSLLMRAVLQRFTDGAEGFPIFPIIGIAIGIMVGGWLVQHAYANGPPEIVVGCLTVVDPLVAVGMGILLLGEGANTPWSLAIAQAASAVVAIGGIVLLTRHRPRSTSDGNTVNADEQRLVGFSRTQQHD